jgi:hypothetical protein
VDGLNFRLQCLDWFAFRPAKPFCVDEKDFLKANVMITCSAPAVGANFGFKSQDVIICGAIDRMPSLYHSRQIT